MNVRDAGRVIIVEWLSTIRRRHVFGVTPLRPAFLHHCGPYRPSVKLQSALAIQMSESIDYGRNFTQILKPQISTSYLRIPGDGRCRLLP